MRKMNDNKYTHLVKLNIKQQPKLHKSHRDSHNGQLVHGNFMRGPFLERPASWNAYSPTIVRGGQYRRQIVVDDMSVLVTSLANPNAYLYNNNTKAL